MHDIGMGFISEAALSGEQQEIPEDLLRGHTEAGARILRAIEVSPEVLAWTEAHHERMDGLGYPAGLAGDEIPLGARALAVLDAFEALTAGLPRTAPVSPAEALEALRRGSGSQFDAAVIDALEQALAAMGATTIAPAALLSEGGSARG
jgi:HD-GYP domain-containing protein (c-di-GMP phosphodiesterase class II)